jgi:hypothetical protein
VLLESTAVKPLDKQRVSFQALDNFDRYRIQNHLASRVIARHGSRRATSRQHMGLSYRRTGYCRYTYNKSTVYRQPTKAYEAMTGLDTSARQSAWEPRGGWRRFVHFGSTTPASFYAITNDQSIQKLSYCSRPDLPKLHSSRPTSRCLSFPYQRPSSNCS